MSVLDSRLDSLIDEKFRWMTYKDRLKSMDAGLEQDLFPNLEREFGAEASLRSAKTFFVDGQRMFSERYDLVFNIVEDIGLRFVHRLKEEDAEAHRCLVEDARIEWHDLSMTEEFTGSDEQMASYMYSELLLRLAEV